MTQHSIVNTVQLYHQAWTSGDVEGAMRLVADDIVCCAPGGDLLGKDAHSEFIAGFAPALTGLTDIGMLADDDHVALFYRPHTAAATTAVAAEYFTVRDGKITESVLVFDRLSFGPPDDQEPQP